MKKTLQNLSIVAVCLFIYAGAFAQNLVQISPSNSSTNCDGIASIDSTIFVSASWYWSNSSGTVIQQGGLKAEQLCPGDYILHYTDSNNTSLQYTFNIQLNTGGNNPCANFNGYINVTPVTDTLACNGVLEVMVTGGKAPYTYVWDNSTNTTSILDMACEGNYNVTVTDVDNCVRTIGAYLNLQGDTTSTGGGTGGNNPCANFNGYINVTPVTDTIACNGILEVMVTGGRAPYTYAWNNSNSTTSNVNNVCVGNYNVIVTDSMNCLITLYAYLNLQGDTTSTGGGNGGTNDPCANSNLNGYMFSHPVTSTTNCDGTVGVNVTGGKAPYTYQWLNVNSNLQVLDSVCSGDYKVEVRDANNCKREFVRFVGIQIDTTGTTVGTINPCANANINGIIHTQFTSDSLTCNGIVKAQGTGGSAPYTYSWNTGSTNAELTNICKGNYQVTITDNKGCSKQLQAYVGFNGVTNTDPCANNNLQGDTHTQPVTNSTNCNGSVQVYASGGKAPYSFVWNNGATSPTLHQVCNGNYSVTITDRNGCTTTASGTVVTDLVTLVDPCLNSYLTVALTTTKTSSPTTCDGSVVTNVTGGLAPYTYVWNNGNTSANIDNACKGMYRVQVKDSNNCHFTTTGYVDAIPTNSTTTQPLNGYVIPVGVSAADMCDGSASLIVYGGTAPYTFNYSNGSTSHSAFNLCKGIQYVSVIDANNDTLKLDFIIASPVNIITTTVSTDLSDSIVVDSLFNSALIDCDIDFQAIISASISNVSISAAGIATVMWTLEFNNNTTIDIVNTYEILNFQNGVYTFVIQVYCPSKAIGQYVTATQAYYVDKSAAIKEIAKNDYSYKVYPNPFNNVLNIELDVEGTTEVIITDVVGKIVLTANFNGQTADIDVNDLSKGQYVLTLKNEKGIRNVTLVK